MARVTVEDCLEHVENRFALIHAAALRTRQLFKNSKPLINCKNKEVVCTLREIADSKVKVIPFKEDTSKD
ncbi:MAG: DNA-directed RNA polymerase subunit omega [Pseudomonadota bacterium]